MKIAGKPHHLNINSYFKTFVQFSWQLHGQLTLTTVSKIPKFIKGKGMPDFSEGGQLQPSIDCNNHTLNGIILRSTVVKNMIGLGGSLKLHHYYYGRVQKIKVLIFFIFKIS
jgi:hypothetical protein